jgi:hypothetical protein
MVRQFKRNIARVRALAIVALPSPLSSNNSNHVVEFVMAGFPKCGTTTPLHVFNHSSAILSGTTCSGVTSRLLRQLLQVENIYKYTGV